MSDDSRRLTLAGFLKFMGLDRDKIVRGKLGNRIKAQKLVYFGKKLGLPLDYDFDIYLYGPYSSKLADDYYKMTQEEWSQGIIEIPEKIEETLRYLMGNDILFLEIATTLDSIRSTNEGVPNNKIIEAVSKLKSSRLEKEGKDINFLKTVMDELSEHHIF